MASLTIRNLDDEVKAWLREQAARHGQSMEQEVRDILQREARSGPTGAEFARRINRRFAALAVEELPIPPRKPVRQPPDATA
ncbi:MAG: toxin-antitoxin system [Wenzhouxiangellaceae bacterium]|nr:toxin-antitoxin system [Wenzhouxiangellaceae bacterium]